jgi:hypothetical protein
MTHQRNYLPEEHQATDQWHHHTVDEGTPQEEHAGTANAAVLMVAFVLIVGFVSLVVLATMLYFIHYTTNERRARVETTVLAKDYRAYRSAEEAKLATYGWEDRAAAEAGHVSIPIDVAMQRVAEKYGGKRADAH